MFSFRTTALQAQEDIILRGGRLAVLCNYTAWDTTTGEYLYQSLYGKYNVRKVLVGNHGFFEESARFPAEPYDGTGLPDCPFVFFRNADGTIDSEAFSDIDALVVDIQDIGSRYSRFLMDLRDIFVFISGNGMDMPVYILDKVNPCGRQVEGTPLREGQDSCCGVEGLPHKHGLTLGEAANMVHSELNAKFPLHVISYAASMAGKDLLTWSIPPMSDFPGFFTAHLFSGQYLWTGTNVSCAVGTCRPYESFGAPFMKDLRRINDGDWNSPSCPVSYPGAFMRPTVFVPYAGIYAGERCYGFQILMNPNAQYHSLVHSLHILREIRRAYPEFSSVGFPECGSGYMESESGSCRVSLARLVGDDLLMSYINGETDRDEVREYIKTEEQKWIRKAKKYMLYDDSLWRVK